MGKDSGLITSFWPHIKSRVSTPKIMLEVIISLLPALGAGIYFFGIEALKVVLGCIIGAGVSEKFMCIMRRRKDTLNDYSFLVTGLLLGLCLPANLPVGIAILGGVVAILIGKEVYGGLGYNIFNPALVGRAFLVASFPQYLTRWISPFDAKSCATPLALWKFQHQLTNWQDLFLGNVGGCLGETSSLALIIGGMYLIIRRIADWRIPLSYIGTSAILSFLFYLKNPLNGSVAFHIFSGGLLLGAFFMATDPVTSPITSRGKIFFGIGCGILTMLIRYFGGLPEGVMYSILFMNALTPLINRVSKPLPFGRKR